MSLFELGSAIRCSFSVFLSLLACLSLGAPPVGARLAVLVDGPDGPIPWDEPTELTVTVRGSCADVAQSEGAGFTELEIGVTGDLPPWLKAEGVRLPWRTTSECNPATANQAASCAPQPACAADYPVAESRGVIRLSPTVDAPAFSLVPLLVAEKRSGSGAAVNVSVAYHGSVDVKPPKDPLVVRAGERASLDLRLDVFTNADSTVTLRALEPARFGRLDGLQDSHPIEPAIAYRMSHGGAETMWMEAGPGAGKPVAASWRLSYVANQRPGDETVRLAVSLAPQADPTHSVDNDTVEWTIQGDRSFVIPGAGFLPALGVLAAGALGWGHNRRPPALGQAASSDH